MQGVSTRSLVQAIPALQSLALMRGRDYVSAEDVERLSAPIFQLRIAMAPGSGDAGALVADAIAGPLETLTRSTLTR